MLEIYKRVIYWSKIQTIEDNYIFPRETICITRLFESVTDINSF